MKISPSPEISIGVAAHGNVLNTQRCLEAIFSSLSGNFELILVDDSSPDHIEHLAVFQRAATKHKNTKIFYFPKQLEYTGSLDCILSEARGRLVFFISNDIYVTPSFFKLLMARANSNPRAGIIRGVSNFVDNGKSSHQVKLAPGDYGLKQIAEIGDVLEEASGGEVIYDDYLTGDAFCITRAALDQVGGIDPLFYGYFGDVDLGIRVARCGFNLEVCLGAFAFHNAGSNFSYLRDEEKSKKVNARFYKVHENWARFKLKYDFPVSLKFDGLNGLDWGALNRDEISTLSSNFIKSSSYAQYQVLIAPA
jgi:GT2 family glycosyltransferase